MRPSGWVASSMKPQAVVTTAPASHRRGLNIRPGGVWLIAALLLLAVPLAVAAWGLGGYSAQRERNNADTRLADSLTRATREYRHLVSRADVAANKEANRPGVQRALHRSSSHALVWSMRPNGELLRWRRPIPVAAMVRKVDFVSKRRTFGKVVVFLPLDHGLASRLRGAAHLSGQQELGLVHGRTIVTGHGMLRLQSGPLPQGAGDIRADGRGYRTFAEDLGSGIRLAALEPSSAIDSRASTARWRVMGLGLAVIAALLAMAYAVSPSIARTRVSKQERERAERVLAHVGDGVLHVDREGVIRLWNPAAEAITGLRSDAICNHPAAETIPGWADIGARVPVARRPGDADDASSPETVPLEIEGREIWLSIVGVSLGDGIVYAFRDVTRERRLEELRAQFVATISHELRTPLASLHGAAMTLLEREHDLHEQTRHDLLDMIAVQSKRLAALVEEILLTGQLDSGSLRVVTKPFDPEELVWTAAAAARLRLGDDTTIDVSLPALLPRVEGDAERTRQVLANLLDNAIKYSPQGGRIELVFEADGDYARFSVRDEGLGIPLGEQKRIFEKFYRLDPDHRRGIGGSGLGLYICRELVRSMNGRIWVESDPGKGATFTFELPVADRVTATA